MCRQVDDEGMSGLESAPILVADPRPNPRTPEPAFAGAVAPGGVVLRLGGSRFVVDMADVAEVAGLPSVTRLPGAPAWLTGVANWRGRLLPLLDLRSLLGATPGPLPSSARLVVVAGGMHGELTAGLVAEAVPGVYDGALDVLSLPPATLPAEASRLVSGQVADRLGPIAVLDVAALLCLSERVDRRRHGS